MNINPKKTVLGFFLNCIIPCEQLDLVAGLKFCKMFVVKSQVNTFKDSNPYRMASHYFCLDLAEY